MPSSFILLFFSFFPYPSRKVSHCLGVTTERKNCAMKLEFGVTPYNLSLKEFHCPWLIHILHTFVTEFGSQNCLPLQRDTAYGPLSASHAYE